MRLELEGEPFHLFYRLRSRGSGMLKMLLKPFYIFLSHVTCFTYISGNNTKLIDFGSG